MIPRERAEPTIKVLDGIGDAMVVIVGFAMRIAPFAVPALIFDVTALFGWEILKHLSFYVIIVLVGYLLHLFGTYSVLLRVFARYSPGQFFKKMIPVMITAFSTSSSNATLPTTIKTSEEELGVPSEIAGFVLPLGATTNMNGSSLFASVVVLFVAQVFGVELSLGTQFLVVFLSVFTAVGAAGVPGGAIPLLIVVLEMVGVPGEGIAIIIGVDRILDMGRTVVNVTGDAVAACFIASSEGYPLKTD
jgi:DAACS family dicarboxylate/amino acid:cation (Na+ or H+) symporter